MKYSLSPQEIPQALPLQFPFGSGYISSYTSSCHNTNTIFLTFKSITDVLWNGVTAYSQALHTEGPPVGTAPISL